jgi:hypothetical protein
MAKVDNPVPNRRPINGITTDRAAQIIYDRLVGQWGLTNAKKIGRALAGKLKAETKRRREGVK